MNILTTYVEGAFTSSQIENLLRINAYAQRWYWWKRASKVPQNPAGGIGEVNNEATAGTLQEAIDAMQSKRGGGVGVLVSAAAPGFVGIDVDNVIHEGDIHPLGIEVLEHFKGVYVEVSPSATGLRIFCTGVLPEGTPSAPTAVGQTHHGEPIKFEMYAAAGAGRFLRTTGATVESTAGVIGPCPAGIEWMSAAMIAARSKTGGGAGPDKGSASASGLSIDAVFEALAELRPVVEDPKAIIAAIAAAAGAKSRSKLAGAWRGVLTPFNGDHSTADMFICSEAVRRGAGHKEDVAAVWRASGLSDREKFKRKDYRASTIAAAARDVLRDLQAKASKSAAPGKAVVIPDQLAAAVAESGDKLILTKGGKPEAIAGNVVVLFRNDPRIVGLLAFNELAQRAERLGSWAVFDRGASDKAGPITDDDVTRVSMWLASEMGMKMDQRELMRGIEAAAMDARYDPLADRLHALGAAWDGVARADSWLTTYARIDDTGCPDYVQAVGRCFLVGAVARALDPGCQMDTVLAIEGGGGAGKSSMFKVLADSVAAGLFADGVHDVSNPVALVEGTSSRWIVEIAELAGVRRAQDVEALKAAITRREDSHRRPYALMPKDYPRRFVFVASTNRTEYLSDPTGALLRRFWPVRTVATESDPIDRAALSTIAAQLWGEAVRLYQSGTPWHLSEADGVAYDQWKVGRELRREDGAFHDELVPYLCEWVDSEDRAKGRSLSTIALAVGDMRTSEGDQAAKNRLADTLRSLGMESVKRGGVKRWHFTDKAARYFMTLFMQGQTDGPKRQQGKAAPTRPTLTAAK